MKVCIVNISEGFIKRPIATSLLMAAIALFGLVAYRSLPVSDLPNVDFPTLLVTAQLPGASPETMGASVATPLENQFSMIAGLESMTSVNSLGSTQVTLEFDLEPQPRRRRGRRPGGDHAGRAPAAAGHADAADLHEGEPGGPADSVSRHHVDDRAAVDARRIRGDAHRAAHLDGQRRRAGAGARQPEVRRARAARSARARLAPDRHQRGRGRAAELERQHADRLDHRPAQGVHAAGDRPADERRPVQGHDRLVPQRRAGAARRARQRHRRRRGSAHRVVVLHATTSRSARSRSASSASPARTRSPSPTPSRRCCRSSSWSCRRASTWTCSTTGRTRSASRTATSSSRWR